MGKLPGDECRDGMGGVNFLINNDDIFTGVLIIQYVPYVGSLQLYFT